MSSTVDTPRLTDERKARLDRLYELREQLQIVAASDIEYAKYAREGLRTLREEGYEF